jgi:hypothetical protein
LLQKVSANPTILDRLTTLPTGRNNARHKVTLQGSLRITLMLSMLVAAGAASSGAQASDSLRANSLRADSLRARYMLPRPAVQSTSPTLTRGIPGITVQSPTGFTAEAGDVFVGVGFQQRPRYVHQPDAALVAGFGIGSAETVALETAVTSYSTVRSGFAKHVAVSFAASRLVTDNTGIALGWESAIHSAGTDGESSVYGAVSKVFSLRNDLKTPFSEMAVTAGLGSGRFRNGADVRDDNGLGGFGSMSVVVIPNVSAIADWSGQNLNLAVSFAPFARFPLVITPAITDITHNAGDGRRFIVGAGVDMNLPKLRGLLGGNR